MKSVPVGGESPIGTKRAKTRNTMTLCYFPSACALADHIVLEWIGAPYETVRMSHASIKAPDYLALNPGGTVPLLIDGDFLLTGARSAADPYLFVMLRWAIHLAMDIGELKNLLYFIERMQADPGVRAALFAEESDVIQHASPRTRAG